MSNPTIKMWIDTENPSIASEGAGRLRTAILNENPEVKITRERSDPEAQDAGAILVVALSHIAVGGIIEGVRLIWEQLREPVRIALPDGSEIAVKGSSPEFIQAIHKLVGDVSDASGGR